MSDVKVKCGTPTCDAQLELTHEELREREGMPAAICMACEIALEESKLPAKSIMHRDSQSALVLMALNNAKRTLTRSELVLAVWKAHPSRFGLAGYTKTFPDAKKLDCVTTHLKLRGLLMRPKQNTYSLTTLGVEKANELEERA